MRRVKTRGGKEKKEPYPLNEFTEHVIHGICERIVHAKAIGQLDISGDQFSTIFAESIDGNSFGSPLGIADVAWNGCGWSVKTVKHSSPHKATSVRLISGRNSPIYSANINDPLEDVQATGTAVLDVYNNRIDIARQECSDLRLLVLVRNMATQEFSMFERSVNPYPANNYTWRLNQNNNLIGCVGPRTAFTWQPHGSQFTIHEDIPSGVTKFKIKELPTTIPRDQVLATIGYDNSWVEILHSV